MMVISYSKIEMSFFRSRYPPLPEAGLFEEEEEEVYVDDSGFSGGI